MTAPRRSFRKAAESWLSESAGSVSEKTIGHYRWVLERFVFPNIEGSLEITGEGVEKLVEGTRKEGLYQFIEKVLGDDRDGKMLVEYLRCNMRVADMPSQKVCTVQTIRSRVARGFAKLMERLDAIYAVEGIDILDMFHKLTARIQEIAPPEPVRPGRKHNPTVGNEFKKAMAALDRIVEKED